MFGAYPDMRWNVKRGSFVRTARHRVEIGPTMLKRARRNLNAVARFVDPGRFAREYAQDLIQCGVEQGVDMVDVAVEETAPCGESAIERQLDVPAELEARRVVKQCLTGRHGWQDADGFSEQVAINYMYAGSERVARAHIASGDTIIVQAYGKLRQKVLRGMNLLAGRTSKDVALKNQQFVCAEKYWAHIEIALRKKGDLTKIQQWLGLRVARKALAAGDWI
jgi:hypothetical protein